VAGADSSAPEFFSEVSTLLRQEYGEEYDSFRERGAQNGLNQNLRRRAGIAPDRFRSLHTNETHADSRAKRSQTDVYATSHFVTFRFSRRLPRLNTVKPAKF
jgi:hypothetical protein